MTSGNKKNELGPAAKAYLDLPALADDWQLSSAEQAELLRILASPAPSTAALDAAAQRAERLFGI